MLRRNAQLDYTSRPQTSVLIYEVDFLAWMDYGVLSHNRKIDDVL
ncbi:hypothetical protein [Paenibacillus sp. MBLB4367]